MLRTEVGTLAVDLASRVVGESLENEARQRRVVERFIEDLENQPAATGAGPSGTGTGS
jgi:F-type H+-transporting ATPase subunit b